jgi:hypothetical protein
VPLVQVVRPVTVTVPAPVSVPADSVSALIDDALAIDIVPDEMLSVAEHCTLLTESDAPVECVIVIPVWPITASSPAPGTCAGLQLLAVSQSPPALLIQFTVAGVMRSSRTCIISRRRYR